MITLVQAKQHLRVTHSLEDTLIQACIDAAAAHIAKYLGDDMPDPVPAPVDAAVLLLTADLYVNRERQSDKPLSENKTYSLLLNPYRCTEVL